jgi:molecular chaperone GrpE
MMTDEQVPPSDQQSEAAAPLPPQEDDYKDKYLRLLAEMENSRKRMHKEKQEAIRFAIENALADIIMPIDNMENALKFVDKMSQETRQWATGFKMILAQFRDALNEHGITAFHSEGELFDPHKHEAVESEETDQYPEGTITQEFVKGYRCGDRTIRPARVKVAKAITQINDKKGE